MQRNIIAEESYVNERVNGGSGVIATGQMSR